MKNAAEIILRKFAEMDKIDSFKRVTLSSGDEHIPRIMHN